METTFPDGSWERTYYGEDIKHARGALKREAKENLEMQGDRPHVRAREAGGRNVVHMQEREAEHMERRGKLAAISPVRINGAPWGGKKRGCDRCGEIHGGLRFVSGVGFVCKRRCHGEVLNVASR